jgi:hypothetical protein
MTKLIYLEDSDEFVYLEESNDVGLILGLVIFLFIPASSVILAELGKELCGELGFWGGILICPVLFILYMFWVGVKYDD